MNIHVTSRDPKECARALDDKRLNKMITETGQLLSTALHELELYNPNLFKPFCPGHTVAEWVRGNFRNYCWTTKYFSQLCNEYRHRKGKKQASERLKIIFADSELDVREKLGAYNKDIQFCNYAKNKSLDLDYTDMDDTVDAYRNYMTDRWDMDDNPTWTNRDKPEWY